MTCGPILAQPFTPMCMTIELSNVRDLVARGKHAGIRVPDGY
jgi:hypothetical protein